MRLLRAAERTPVLWRNGGGTTAEIAGDEAGGWRVSLATIVQAGPFSAFPELRRSLAVVEGGPVTLAAPGWQAMLGPDDAPFGFEGEEAVSASVAARARVVNAMTDRGRFVHEARRFGPGRIAADGDRLVLVLTGNYGWAGALLARFDALLLNRGEAVTIARGSGVGVAIAAIG